ncbi:MAG: hypothetical protein AVDCRST_MAG49-680 [uncultured Thermomicrobiales bacterium]|uniref:Uncharacterized protein n=1 Tax=uncultured Thermomicrobiales bacterium TaxID=1645740 RepID=A0A6J4U2S8_9BACT|nr:MAG: hypothetical protein AVDCRST_MAG49-680 [uncultured Thermomicrobiales bacterium]
MAAKGLAGDQGHVAGIEVVGVEVEEDDEAVARPGGGFHPPGRHQGGGVGLSLLAVGIPDAEVDHHRHAGRGDRRGVALEFGDLARAQHARGVVDPLAGRGRAEVLLGAPGHHQATGGEQREHERQRRDGNGPDPRDDPAPPICPAAALVPGPATPPGRLHAPPPVVGVTPRHCTHPGGRTQRTAPRDRPPRSRLGAIEEDRDTSDAPVAAGGGEPRGPAPGRRVDPVRSPGMVGRSCRTEGGVDRRKGHVRLGAPEPIRSSGEGWGLRRAALRAISCGGNRPPWDGERTVEPRADDVDLTRHRARPPGSS